MYVALIGFGVWGAQNADLDRFVNPPADCSQLRRRLGADGDDPPSADDWLITFKNHAYFFAPMLVFLLAVGVAWIWLLRHCARVVTYVTLAMVPVGCFVGAGAILTGSMPVIDVETGEELGRGEVPSWCVAVAGTRPKRFAGGEFGLPAVLVLKRLEEGQRHDKSALNDILRDHGQAV